eukprot:COSAG01_NODE_7701_length_3092_cov_2.395256_3_plen_37_part_00
MWARAATLGRWAGLISALHHFRMLLTGRTLCRGTGG